MHIHNPIKPDSPDLLLTEDVWGQEPGRGQQVSQRMGWTEGMARRP